MASFMQRIPQHLLWKKTALLFSINENVIYFSFDQTEANHMTGMPLMHAVYLLLSIPSRQAEIAFSSKAS